MMETFFLLINGLVLPFWALMILLPRWSWTRRLMQSPWMVAPFALIYTGLVLASLGMLSPGLTEPTLPILSELLGTPQGTVTAWAHLLTFDLFVGRWIYLDSRDRAISAWLMAPILILTLMFGPFGFLVYLIARTLNSVR